jgi:MFS transporter, CP family, cyanate transporter
MSRVTGSTVDPPVSAAPRRAGTGLALLTALFVASLALRPQLVGVGPLLPDVEADLGVSHAVAGLLGTIPVMCMAVFAPAAAPLTAWASLRTAIAACVFGVAAFGLARAAAPGAGLVLALTLPVGVGIAVAGALLPVAVKARFAERPAFATGVYTTGLSVGAALASALAVPLADAFGGWRGALAAFSAATVVLAIGWLLLSRGTWTSRAAERAPRLPVRRGIVWWIVAVFGLQSAIFYAFVSWMPDAFQERGWSAATAGALAAVFGLAALPVGLLVPWLADRAGSRRLWLVGASAVTVVGMLGLAALPGAAFAWATIAGAAIGAVFPLSLTLCLDVAHGPADAGAVSALVLLGGYTLSSLSPVGLGALRDATGSFSPVLWTMFGAAVVLLACCLPLTAERLKPA